MAVEDEPEDARAEPVLTAPAAALATAAWLALVLLQLLSLESGAARVEAFDHPADTAARFVERPLEMVAAGTRLADVPALGLGGTGDGPLGLDERLVLDAASTLATAALEVDAAARDLGSRRGADDEEATERVAHLRGEAAELAARALVLAASVGADAADLAGSVPSLVAERAVSGGDAPVPAARVEGLLAGDAQLAAAAPALAAELLGGDGAGGDGGTEAAPVELPARLDGLTGLVVLDHRRELPPVREWAASRALERAAGPLGAALALLPFALVLAFVLVVVRRALLTPERPLSARVPLVEGFGAFAVGQVGFTLVGGLLLAVGAGGVTGYSVAVSSLPILAASLVAGGWRRGGGPGADLRTAAWRLGLTGPRGGALRTLACGLGALPIMFAGLLVFGYASPLAPGLWSNPYLDLVVAGGPDLVRRMAIEAGVAAPIFEELAYRGVLFAALRSRTGFAPAALSSSLLFAIAHPYDPAGILVIAWVGFALAWLYERTGSLVACMVAHAAFNLTQLSFMLLFL